MPINNKTFICHFLSFFTPTTFGSFGYTSHLSTLKFRFLKTVQQILAPHLFLAGGAGVSKRIKVFVSSSNSSFRKSICSNSCETSSFIANPLCIHSMFPALFSQKETVYNFTVSKLLNIINFLLLLYLSFQYVLLYVPYFLSHGKTVSKQS